MLAIHTEIQEKVYDEIKRIVYSSESELDMNSLTKLQYLDQVIKETLRLLPIAPMISRSCRNDIILDDLKILKGTVLFFNFFALHRRSDFWGEFPNKFNPDNFSPENCSTRHPFAYLPFSAGKRNCPGMLFATISIKTLIIKFLLTYKLTTSLKFDQLRFKSDVTLKMCTPHLVSISKR